MRIVQNKAMPSDSRQTSLRFSARSRGQGAHSIAEPSIPASIARAPSGSISIRPEKRRGGDHRSHSCQTSPSGDIVIPSRNLPATTSSIISARRIVSSFAVSSQASQPHTGKASVNQRPAPTLSPGNVVKVTVRGAAFESRGTSLTLGRATAPTSNSRRGRGPRFDRRRTMLAAARATSARSRAAGETVPDS